MNIANIIILLVGAPVIIHLLARFSASIGRGRAAAGAVVQPVVDEGVENNVICPPDVVHTRWGRIATAERYNAVVTANVDCFIDGVWEKDVAVDIELPLNGCPTEASRPTVEATKTFIDNICLGDDQNAILGAKDILKRTDGSPLLIQDDDIMRAVTVGADGWLSVADTFGDNIYTPSGWMRPYLHVVRRDRSPGGAIVFDQIEVAMGSGAGSRMYILDGRLRSLGNNSTGGLLVGTPFGYHPHPSYSVQVKLLTDPAAIAELVAALVYNPDEPESVDSSNKMPTIDSVPCRVGFLRSGWGLVSTFWRVPVPESSTDVGRAESYSAGRLNCIRGDDRFYPLRAPFAVPLDACPDEASRESLVATRALMDQLCGAEVQEALLASLDIQKRSDGSPLIVHRRHLWGSIDVAAGSGALTVSPDRFPFDPAEFTGNDEIEVTYRFVVWQQRTIDGSVIFDPINLAVNRTAAPVPGPAGTAECERISRAILDPVGILSLVRFWEEDVYTGHPRIASFHGAPTQVDEALPLCSVCLEGVQPGLLATNGGCQHTFHGDCLQRWLATPGVDRVCPMCFTPVVTS